MFWCPGGPSLTSKCLDGLKVELIEGETRYFEKSIHYSGRPRTCVKNENGNAIPIPLDGPPIRSL